MLELSESSPMHEVHSLDRKLDNDRYIRSKHHYTHRVEHRVNFDTHQSHLYSISQCSLEYMYIYSSYQSLLLCEHSYKGNFF